MSRMPLVIRNLPYIASLEDDDDEIDPADLAPLESCLAPIVTVPASEDESESEDGSIPALETDLSSISQKLERIMGSIFQEQKEKILFWGIMWIWRKKLVLNHLMNGQLFHLT